MSRLKLSDTRMSVIAKMCEGNPGAMEVLIQMMSPASSGIDPDSIIGGLSKILRLDTLGIYGTDIYVLHNDICERNLVKTFAVLRANELGFLEDYVLQDACRRQDYSGKDMINVDALYIKVKEALPGFMNLKY